MQFGSFIQTSLLVEKSKNRKPIWGRGKLPLASFSWANFWFWSRSPDRVRQSDRELDQNNYLPVAYWITGTYVVTKLSIELLSYEIVNLYVMLVIGPE